MAKTLRSLTIIPDELYVERDADRQLARIVANMGRPGYVLVARQMGKTNLLLHARSRAIESGIFVYLDLSNAFPDVRSFLRNIIDVAVESTPELREVMRQIHLARSNIDRLPHKEHEWELRALLAEYSGKIVICLDEIDSLTKSEYSDQVFSFIRSVYFSGRANFSELGRLTYLLSGVAEPSDIIKNRDVSPFNIGEKILLQDFTREELGELIKRAGLPLSEATIESIYGWTSGHPRMSWDVCSKLEDLLEEGGTAEPSAVDGVVKSLYFAEVEMPPVDQIKRLAEDSAEIRDALISVHYGRGGTIPEATRTKLYLAGVCQAPQAKSVEFKNKILEEALSEKFLLSIEQSEIKDAPIIAGERDFNAGRFESALANFENALKFAQVGEDANLQGLAHFWLGRTKFALGEPESASAEHQTASTLLNGYAAILNYFYLGHLYLARANFRQARAELERVVNEAASTAIAHEAAVDLATAIVAMDPSDKNSVAISLCEKVCAAAAEVLNAPGLMRMGGDTLALSHYTLASVYLRRGKPKDSAEEIEAGLESAGLNVQIRLLMLQMEAQPDLKEFLLKKCKSLMLTGTLVADGSPQKHVSYDTCRDLMFRLERSGRTGDALDLMDHMIDSTRTEFELVELLDRVGVDAIHGSMASLAGRLFERTFQKHHEKFSPDDARRFITTICTVSPERTYAFSEKFLDLVENQGGELGVGELSLVNNIIFYSVSSRNVELAQRALSLLQVEPSDLGVMGAAQKNSWEIFKEYLDSYSGLAFNSDVISFERARRLLWVLQGAQNFELGNLGLPFVELMTASIEKELRALAPRFGEIRRVRKIGRNEIVTVKYGDTLKVGKYKYFQSDIKAGRCTLINA